MSTDRCYGCGKNMCGACMTYLVPCINVADNNIIVYTNYTLIVVSALCYILTFNNCCLEMSIFSVILLQNNNH